MFFNVKYNRYCIYYILFLISCISKVYRGPGARGDFLHGGKTKEVFTKEVTLTGPWRTFVKKVERGDGRYSKWRNGISQPWRNACPWNGLGRANILTWVECQVQGQEWRNRKWGGGGWKVSNAMWKKSFHSVANSEVFKQENQWHDLIYQLYNSTGRWIHLNKTYS